MYNDISNLFVDKKDQHSVNVGLAFYKIIHKILALFVVLWLNLGAFSFFLPHAPSSLRYGTFTIWFFISIFTRKKFLLRLITNGWPFIVFYLYIFLISAFVKQYFIPVYLQNFTYLFMVYSIFLYYYNDQYQRFLKILSVTMLIDCGFIAINTYKQLQENPLLARYLSTGTDTKEMLLGSISYNGVGSYGYFYGLVAIILLLSYLFINYTRKSILFVLPIVGFVVVLIKASFTIAILDAFIFIGVTLVDKYSKKNPLIPLFVGALILTIFGTGIFTWLLNLLANTNGVSPEISVRLYELSAFFSGDSIHGSDLQARGLAYSLSIDAFLHNFIAGISLSYNSDYIAGGHSAWFDLLAHFGLFSILFFVFLYKVYKNCLEGASENHKNFVKIYWFYFFCLGFTNTTLFANIFTIWLLFMPIFLKAFYKRPSLATQNLIVH